MKLIPTIPKDILAFTQGEKFTATLLAIVFGLSAGYFFGVNCNIDHKAQSSQAHVSGS